jgi:hypothetical protein
MLMLLWLVLLPVVERPVVNAAVAVVSTPTCVVERHVVHAAVAVVITPSCCRTPCCYC